MRHRIAMRRLGRDGEHRWAMLRNQVTSLIEHERIRTTLPKAKELRRVAEQVVTLAKQNDICARRQAQGIVRTKTEFDKLFDTLGPRYMDRAGGYTRIVKADFRYGDNAEMAVIEYIDRPGELRRAKPGTAHLAKKQEE
ncbi:50S ribosomal protein L17 [Saprolegnia diclina VS20]|uniref:Large ribosomal subunit protein bL17c n=2 Tax=Saprolegnia TaxID=4769 RepID=A0A067C838_SAPPC|nr:50S ribosomal protein L17 [Saprolegnia diclina VS20]XP_012206278.1 50S ribosomal protein L17 [Saprolegnia parasitica CBS 223.65]EQC26276.1 50S ribosomal protein L17 [Saprolegnia diclina VS20]KDO22987.1 50S ribosomal protein L17 [Saprolegnia parasitica CBS 223.65]|eukprot:XP_008620271.1 50S ribosomal protein L17 [Saprolegnia diclina VS20]